MPGFRTPPSAVYGTSAGGGNVYAMKSSQTIRNEFIRFFEERGHTFVPSSPLLPAEDPTLLFTNAGMNQFKDIFLGRETRDYARAVNTQKCIRAGGKHNDLEDVGHDTYHHTFFEMLGNWSFGDYYKAEAIEWAWELLTGVWGLDPDRLHVTVFEGDPAEGLEPDDESAELWRTKTPIDPSHIHKGNKKDNFWEMGETGPCGPNSEIHIDLTTDASGAQLVNAGDPRVIEIWNLVFIQYNRDDAGTLSPLPAKHVDTGMGFERICAVLRGKKSNYATDLFVPLIEEIEGLTSHRYGSAAGAGDRFDTSDMDNMGDVACRVVADHARTLAFAITDGILPSNEGRGYVLRRILRRAARYGRQYLGIEGPFLCKLVPKVVELMGGFFTELKDRRDYVIETIRDEEESFGRTLDRGLEIFRKQADRISEAGRQKLPGDVAFDLYATYGFPVDLTQLMAAERGMTVDMDGFDAQMARHREISASEGKFKAAEIPDLPPTDDSAKYALEPVEAKVLGWVRDGEFETTGALEAGDEAAVLLDRTNFYAEQGGQVGDAGHLTAEGVRFAVRDTQLAGGGVLHVGIVEAGALRVGQTVRCEVDASRRDTMRNHTATHLLNWALREVLGEHVNQAGSVVAPDRLRFDFSHNQALTAEQLADVERRVNERVLADEPVETAEMPLAKARKIPGVRAVFGEKYGERVRVLAIGGIPEAKAEGEAEISDFQSEIPDLGFQIPAFGSAVEFCGGTHLARTSQVGLFKILSEESVAKGVRRITAVTGRGAVEYVQRTDAVVRETAAALKVAVEEVPDRITAMQKELKKLRKGGGKPKAAASGDLKPEAVAELPEGKVLVGRVDPCDAGAMRGLCDVHRQRGAAGLLVAGADGKKVILIAMVAEDVAKQGKLKANEWVQAAAAAVGGSGGGKPTMAQAGGKSPEKLDDALKAAGEWARERLA